MHDMMHIILNKLYDKSILIADKNKKKKNEGLEK